LCGRRKCRTDFAALRRHDMLGCYHIPEMSIKPGIEGASETHDRYPTPRTCISPPKTSIKSAIKNALGPDRPWLQVAGPKLTGDGLRLATVGAPSRRPIGRQRRRPRFRAMSCLSRVRHEREAPEVRRARELQCD
jgi:hypothetical protein